MMEGHGVRKRIEQKSGKAFSLSIFSIFFFRPFHETWVSVSSPAYACDYLFLVRHHFIMSNSRAMNSGFFFPIRGENIDLLLGRGSSSLNDPILYAFF